VRTAPAIGTLFRIGLHEFTPNPDDLNLSWYD